MSRDPRVDPLPGDIVRSRKAIATNRVPERTVVRVAPGGVEYRSARGDFTVTLTAWREWCERNDAEVIRTA